MLMFNVLEDSYPGSNYIGSFWKGKLPRLEKTKRLTVLRVLDNSSCLTLNWKLTFPTFGVEPTYQFSVCFEPGDVWTGTTSSILLILQLANYRSWNFSASTVNINSFFITNLFTYTILYTSAPWRTLRYQPRMDIIHTEIH